MTVKPDQPQPASGYSGTPLSKKLGIKPGHTVWLIKPPDGYQDWLRPLPGGTVFRQRQAKQVDLVHLFMTRQGELLRRLEKLRQVLDTQVPVWVSWPKKSSGVASTITEDTIRDAALPLGYVDIKVCAVNETWSGLKLVVRKELR